MGAMMYYLGYTGMMVSSPVVSLLQPLILRKCVFRQELDAFLVV